MSVQEKAEEKIIKTTGFSSDLLNSLKDTFEDVYAVIHHYLEHSQGMSKKLRGEIVNISFQADRTKLELDKLIVEWIQMMSAVQKQAKNKKKTRFDFSKIMNDSKKVQEDISKLIDRISSFITKVEKSF